MDNYDTQIKELQDGIEESQKKIRELLSLRKEERERQEKESLNIPITLAQKPFLSLEGESLRQGSPVLFIRTQICNMFCHGSKYPNCKCDSVYSIGKYNPNAVTMTIKELLEEIKKADCKNISITGGEPLLHMKEIYWLLYNLSTDNDWTDGYERTSDYDVTIETNGSIDFTPIQQTFGLFTRIIGDWKCPTAFGEDAHSKMKPELLWKYRSCDALKFVVTKEDLAEVERVLTENPGLDKRTNVYLSPAFGCIDLPYLAQWIIDHRKWRLRLSLQIHKIIWDKDNIWA